MKYAYTGDAEQVYPQFIDTAKGSTLVAEPGKTYDIAPAEGHAVKVPPDARWKPATAAKTPKDAE